MSENNIIMAIALRKSNLAMRTICPRDSEVREDRKGVDLSNAVAGIAP
jgi:hypothetical protein